jgi:hypothetical protein
LSCSWPCICTTCSMLDCSTKGEASYPYERPTCLDVRSTDGVARGVAGSSWYAISVHVHAQEGQRAELTATQHLLEASDGTVERGVA